ncbi:hypothetical protein TRVA0_001S06524 [Trichomonascus vanleenenianus]|uniref:Mms4p n=1 Tax=Trichomonascus vanleenenianus TaxID=2268995 RepID=UPI003EC95A51
MTGELSCGSEVVRQWGIFGSPTAKIQFTRVLRARVLYGIERLSRMSNEIVVIESESHTSDDEVIIEKKVTIPSSPPVVTSSIPSDFSIPSTILRKKEDEPSRAFKSKSAPNVATPRIAARLFGLDSDPLNISPLEYKESEVIVLTDESESSQRTKHVNTDPFVTDDNMDIPTSPDDQSDDEPNNAPKDSIDAARPASSFEFDKNGADQAIPTSSTSEPDERETPTIPNNGNTTDSEVVIIDSSLPSKEAEIGGESDVACTAPQEVKSKRVLATPKPKSSKFAKPRSSKFGLSSDELDNEIDQIFFCGGEASTQQQLVNCISSSSQTPRRLHGPFSSSQSIGIVPNTQSSIGRTLSLNTGSEILSPKPASPMIARKTKSAVPRKTREEKAKEKGQALENKLKRKALEAANRAKRGRTDSTAEIILNVTGAFHDSSIGFKVKEALGEFGTEILTWDCDDVEYVDLIRYQRKVTSRYNHEEDIYVPCDMEIHEENQGIVFVEASNFVKLLDLNIFDKHLEKVQEHFEGKRIIYVIQGLQQVLRKAANEKNREVAARVRQLMNSKSTSAAPPSSQRATRTSSTNEIDTKEIEMALTRMEVELCFRVLHTANFLESSDLIVDLTHDIGAAPYKRTKLLTNENVEIGTIRSGADAKDTFIKSLEQIKYVTPGVAQAISSRYTGIKELRASLTRQGIDALVGIRKGDTGRAIGRSLAEQIRSIFHSKDPNEFVSI